MRKTLILPFFLSLIIYVNCLYLRGSGSQSQHRQIGTFADVINNSNHINGLDVSVIAGQQSSSSGSKSNPPKVALGIVIPIICVSLCCIFSLFCFKCVRNQQAQAQSSLEETIPCYCGPFKLICKFCKYLVCADILLRCLGVRSTNYEKKQRQRLKQEEKLKIKEQKQDRKKGTRDQEHNPYQTVMKRQVPEHQSKWRLVPSQIPALSTKSDRDRVKQQKCQICLGKGNKPSNIMTNCSGHCVFHLQCLIDHKNNHKQTQNVNVCPCCKSNYFNIVRFYCQKCWNRYTEMLIQSGNVYASQLDFGEALKSIGGERCDDCVKKKWFWQ